MSSTTTSLSCNNFTGIKGKEAVFSDDSISCYDCQNVELYYTNQNSGVGLRVSNGNYPVISTVLEGYIIYEMFNVSLGGNDWMFLYAVNDEEETSKILYYDNVGGECVEVTDISGTSKKCSGTYFEQGWLDMFVISNGEEMKYIYIDTEDDEAGLQVLEEAEPDEDGNYVSGDDTYSVYDSDSETTTYYPFIPDGLVDVDGRTVCGLGCINFDSRLWVFQNNVLWYSEQAECRRFNFVDPDYVTSAGYIEFAKEITAIDVYNGQLAVFFKDGYKLVTTDTTTGFGVGTENYGGCSEVNSLLYHGTDLYFYDDVKKGVYSLSQTATGDTAVTDNLAEDVVTELNTVSPSEVGEGAIKALSVVTSDRNEMWLLLPHDEEDKSLILIYDYVRGTWMKRVSNKITSICVHDNKLYSAYDGIFKEYTSSLFGNDREFIASYYRCSTLNLESDTTLKITKYPPRVTIEASSSCNFWVQYIKNYDEIDPAKNKLINAKTSGYTAYYLEEYTDESTGNTVYYDPYNGKTYESADECPYLYVEDGYDEDSLGYDVCNYLIKTNAVVKLPSITFKALGIKFYTSEQGQSFDFKALEFTKIKVKQV